MKKTFLEKLLEIDAYLSQKKQDNIPEEKPYRMPFMKLVFSPFNFFIDNFKNISIAILIYSAIFTVFSFIMGFPFICSIPGIEITNFPCSDSGVLYAVYLGLKMFIIAGFAITFYDVIFYKQLDYSNIYKLNMRTLKVFCAMVTMLLLNMIPLASFQILLMRTPNPDWRVESIFFTIIGIGFLVPFVVMRFNSIFGYFIETGSIIPLKPVWNITKGNSLRILIALFLIIIFSLLALANYLANFKVFDSPNLWFTAILSEYVYNVIFLIIMGLIVGHLYTQRAILIDDSDEEEEYEAANENKK